MNKHTKWAAVAATALFGATTGAMAQGNNGGYDFTMWDRVGHTIMINLTNNYTVTRLPADFNVTNDTASATSHLYLRYIKAGTAGVIGSEVGEYGREQDPVETRQTVTLNDGYYIGVYPVTAGQYINVMGGISWYLKRFSEANGGEMEFMLELILAVMKEFEMSTLEEFYIWFEEEAGEPFPYPLFFMQMMLGETSLTPEESIIALHEAGIPIPLTVDQLSIPSYLLFMGGGYTHLRGSDDPLYAISANENGRFMERLNYHVRQNNAGVNAIGFDFPTEAQWEIACRAGTTGTLYDGDDLITDLPTMDSRLNDVAWWGMSSQATPPGIGLKKANRAGLYDMYGPLAEMCLDVWDDVNTSGDLPMTGSSVWRSVRGNTYDASPARVRSASRLRAEASHGEGALGFRLRASGAEFMAPPAPASEWVNITAIEVATGTGDVTLKWDLSSPRLARFATIDKYTVYINPDIADHPNGWVPYEETVAGLSILSRLTTPSMLISKGTLNLPADKAFFRLRAEGTE